MFNWFKNKHNYLVPNDVEKGFMTSYFCTIKIGEKITIPENVICFVSFKDKLYATLNEGSYILSRELLLDLYQKQLKLKDKINHLNLDLFFVNCKPFELDFSFVDKVPVLNKLTKLIFDVSVTLNVDNATTFYKLMVGEVYSVDAVSSNKLILSYIEEFLRKYFLKKKLTKIEGNIKEIEDLELKLTNSLNKIGMELKSIKLNISSKDTSQIKEHKSTFFQTVETKPEILIDEEKNLQYNTINKPTNNLDSNINQPTNEEQPKFSSEMSSNICPNCRGKKINGSIYCHICGYKFN